MNTKTLALSIGLSLSGTMATAQQIIVTGRVTSNVQAASPSRVQVQVKETKKRMAVTDQGLYVIEANKGQTLQFIYKGKVIKTFVVDSPQLDVALDLPEEQKDSLTSTSGTKDDVILSTSSRGATSISGQARPLWVLNGIVLGSSYGSLESFAGADPKQVVAGLVPGLSAENIASVRLLTSNSETSSYGPRGIAGVVEITTKSGTAGISSLSYRGEFTYRPIPIYREVNIMTSQEHVSLIQDLMDGGQFPIHTLETDQNRGLMGRMYELFNEQDATGKPKLTNDQLSRLNYLRQAERRNTNWFNELYRNTIIQNHTLSFSGGTEKTNLFASLTARIDPGSTIGSRSNSYSGSISSDYKLLPTLKLGLNIIGEYTNSEEPQESVLKYINTTSRALDPNEFYAKDYVSYNIFNELNDSKKTRTQGYLSLQGTAEWSISKYLRATFLADLKYTNTVTFSDDTENSVLARSMRAMQTSYIRSQNKNLRTDPNDPFALPYSVLPEGGIRETKLSQNYLNTLKLHIDYNRTFGKHRLATAAEAELNLGDTQSNTNTNYGVLFGLGYHTYYLPDAITRLYEQGKNYYAIRNRTNNNLAYLLQANYSYAGRYDVSALLRFDASNRFGPSRYVRWLPTWNLEFSWNVSKEAFFKSLKPLSSLQVKTYYGVSADNPSETNSLEEIYPEVPWRPDSREIGLGYKNLANHELTYEKTRTLGATLALGAFKERISLGLDIYDRNSYDLVGPVYTQAVGGVPTKRGNVAELRSSGIELTLSSVNISTSNFTWRTAFSYMHKTNKITKLLSNPTVRTMIGGTGFSYEGYPLSSLFSIPFAGLTEDGIPNFYDADGSKTLGGINLSSSNVSFLTYSGTLVPTDLGVLSNTFRYKRWSLGTHISYQFGAVTRLRYISGILNDRSALPHELDQRWKRSGDEMHTDIPRVPTSYAFDQYGSDNLVNGYYAYDNSTARVVKTDFIRLKELSLEYSFDKKILRHTPLKNLSMRLQAQNLFLIYSDARLRGDDPEYMYGSNVTAPKRLILTLRVGF